MSPVRVLVLLMLAGCGDRRIPLSDESVLVAKCTFGEGADSIESGDPFIYVFEGAARSFSVFTSVARVSDSLRERTTPHEVDLVEPAELESRRLDWSDGSISLGDPNGEIQTAIGTLEGSQEAYPRCVFWAR